MSQIQLIVKHDRLYTRFEDIVDTWQREVHADSDHFSDAPADNLVMNISGMEPETFDWPNTNEYYRWEEDSLVSALYGDRECGMFPSDVNEAVLPDGSVVEF